MTNNSFNILGNKTLSVPRKGKLDRNSIYKPSKELVGDGYKYDSDGLYCPLGLNCIENLYLKIERGYQYYGYTIGSYDNNFKAKTTTANSKKSICTEDQKRNKALFQNIKKIGDNIQEVEIVEFNESLTRIGVRLNKEKNFQQITKEFGVYKNKEEPKNKDGDDSFLIEIEEEIQHRKNPKLTEEQISNAETVKDEIMKKGLIPYLNDILNKMHIGSHKNIYRKLLAALNIMRGKGSYLIETTARAGEGKSLEDEIIFEKMIPQEYIFKKNNMTVASFLRYGGGNAWYFTRYIVIFGDLGSKKSFQNKEQVFDVYKILITENEYSSDVSEKNSSGNYETKSLDLAVESIGAVYSTTLNNFTEGDPQLESRTLKCTPFDNKTEDILDFIFYLNFPESKQSMAKKEAEDELLLFQSYLLSLVSFDEEIINPYSSIFKRYLKGSSVPFRELKQLLGLFDAYCVLTNFNCDEKNGHLVASKEQLTEFLTDVCLDNVLIPYEYNFIDMLKGKNKTRLKIINEEIDADEQQTDPLTEYFNAALEDMHPKSDDGNDDNRPQSFSDLDIYKLKQAVNKLLKFYKLGGTSADHKENVFFRKTDIKRLYGRYKAYKDIDDVSKLLHSLYLKGYINKLEFKDPNNNENIYYLTSKCEDIKFSLDINDEDEKQIENFFIETGFYDTA